MTSQQPTRLHHVAMCPADFEASLRFYHEGLGMPIIWDAVVTFIILMVIKHVFRMKLRLPDDVLEIGDVAVHGEEAYPSDELVSVGSSMADEASLTPPDGKMPEKAATRSADDR